MAVQIKGFDASHYQGIIDFPKTKAAGYEFVFIKATQGTTYVDPQFETYFKDAQAAGLEVGAYHFGTFATVDQAKTEAAFFISHLQGKKLTYPAVLDMEQNKGGDNPQQLTDACIAFLEVLEAAGYFAMIYSGKSFFENQLQPDRLTPYADWIARYGSSVLGRTAGIWQFSDSGHIDGISGNVDLDVAYEDFAADIQGMSGPPPQPKPVTVITPPPPPPKPAPAPVYRAYVVQPGDSLSAIAVKYNTSVSAIASLNNISNPNAIYAGQHLNIPNASGPAPEYHIVVRGDSVSGLAQKYGSTVAEIVKWNGLKSANVIYLNQKLRVK